MQSAFLQYIIIATHYILYLHDKYSIIYMRCQEVFHNYEEKCDNYHMEFIKPLILKVLHRKWYKNKYLWLITSMLSNYGIDLPHVL